MATHVIRPSSWAEQVAFLYPTLKSGDKLYVHTEEQKAAIDILFLTWGLEHRVHVLLPELPDESPANCARCTAPLKQGFAFVYGCYCGLHKQTCPKLWTGITEAKLWTIQNKYNAYCSKPVDTSSLTEETANAPCNCGGDELNKKIGKGDPDEYD